MNDAEKAKLQNELRQFTGSEVFYCHPLFSKYVYTEGIQCLAKTAGAYWLLEYIFSKQEISAISKEVFQVWIIQVQDDDSAVIILEDGNKNEVVRFRIPYTDFPIREFTLWFIDGTLLLPSEY